MLELLFDDVPRSSSIISHPLSFTFSRSNFSFVHINLVLCLLLLTLSSDIQVLILKLASLCFPACLVQWCRLSTSCLKDVYPYRCPAFLNQHPSVPRFTPCVHQPRLLFATCCFLLVILIGGRYSQQHPQAGIMQGKGAKCNILPFCCCVTLARSNLSKTYHRVDKQPLVLAILR